MRPTADLQAVKRLLAEGLNDCQISRRTGIPRGTVRGWRITGRAEPLDLDRRISTCCRCGADAHEPERLDERAYAYLLGMYLGDGCISTGRRGVFRLRIVLDRRYPAVVDECRAAMEAVLPTNRASVLPKSGAKAVEVYSYSKQWPCWLPQHGPGPKHLRSLRLAAWQQRIVENEPEALLRGLIHSDGSRYLNRVGSPQRRYSYPSYGFCNASGELLCLFSSSCDRLGISWRLSNERRIAVTRRQAVDRMDEFIGPKR